MLSQRALPLVDFIAPPALRPGDLIRVVAPAGPFDRTLFWRGVGWLSEHFRVRFRRDIFEREGFLAGRFERRTKELNEALRCDETRAVVCARGGYGSGQIAQSAAFTELRKKPKWLIGFSDVTALHIEAQRQGVMSLHAHNVTGLGPGDALERARWLAAVAEPGRPGVSYTLHHQRGSIRRGVLVGGNLTLVLHATLAGRFNPPPGALLFLEEVAETPYRIARLLAGLETCGVFDTISGLVVGQVTPGGSDHNGVTPFEVFDDIARKNGLALGWGLESGHQRPNLPLVLGREAILHGARLTLP
jgi:muramoyltetrapeptide carboxypeptidase